jgi:hypothetical protein
MSLKIPVVIANGLLEQLQSGDTLAGALTGLTATRVPYAASATTLTDSANLRYDGTNVILSGLKYPNTDGQKGYVLGTDGAANLGWTSSIGTSPVAGYVYSFDAWPTGAARNGSTICVGYRFTVASNTFVSALGRLYIASNVSNHIINIWDESAPSTPVVTATVLAASASDSNSFKWVAITPYKLLTGHTYRIAINEQLGGDFWKTDWDTTGYMNSLVTVLSNCWAVGVSVYPNSTPVTAGYSSSTPAMRLVSGSTTLQGQQFPPIDGTAGQILSTNGTGTLSWVDKPAGITGLTATRVPYAASATTLTDSANLTFNGTTLNLTALATPYSLTDKTLSASFNGAANEKFDLYFTGAYEGVIEVSVSARIYNTGENGLLTKRFVLRLNSTGGMNEYTSHGVTAVGAIVNHIAIGEVAWDAGNARWKIPIAHLTNQSLALVPVRVCGMSFYNPYIASLSGALLSAPYTTDTTVFPALNVSVSPDVFENSIGVAGLSIGKPVITPGYLFDLVGQAPGIRQSVERASGGVAFAMFHLEGKNTSTGLSAVFGEIGCSGAMNSGATPPSGLGIYFGVGSDAAYNVNALRIYPNGLVGIGPYTLSATAYLHLTAGTAAASTAPLKFTSGTNLTTAEAGAMEFTTDDLYFTITTAAARKGIVLNDGANLTSGMVPIASTNGRLIDGAVGLAGTTTYLILVAGVPKTFTFTNGILVSVV